MDDVGRLIQHAGARDPVDTARMENARTRVAAHWEAVVEERRSGKRVTRFRLLGIAASIIAVVGVSFALFQSTYMTQVTMMAQIDKIVGGVVVAGRPAIIGSEIGEDTLIETGADGLIALKLAGGQSLRIDKSSQLVVHAPNRLSLQSGGVYIDTFGAAESLPILVSTPMGTAQDVGTQFQVRFVDSVLVIGVRDGLVEVAPDGQQNLSVNKGRYVELGPAGEKKDGQLERDDPSWVWVESITPEFDIEGASLKDYLAWYANERGFSLKWANGSEDKAASTTLSGPITGASLSEGFEYVRRIAPFEWSIHGEELWIELL